MVTVAPSVAPLAHLHVQAEGVVTIDAIDAAQVLVAFDGFTPPLAAPCPVVVEVAPDTRPTMLAGGVLHYIARRILSCPGADVRVVGEASLHDLDVPAYLRRALTDGPIRLFETLEDALLAPCAGVPGRTGGASPASSFAFAG